MLEWGLTAETGRRRQMWKPSVSAQWNERHLHTDRRSLIWSMSPLPSCLLWRWWIIQRVIYMSTCLSCSKQLKKEGPSSPSMNCFSWLHWYQSWCFHVCVTYEPKYMWIVCWWQTRREETFQTCSKSEAASKEIKVKMLTKFWRNYANFMCAQQKKWGDF